MYCELSNEWFQWSVCVCVGGGGCRVISVLMFCHIKFAVFTGGKGHIWRLWSELRDCHSVVPVRGETPVGKTSFGQRVPGRRVGHHPRILTKDLHTWTMDEASFKVKFFFHLWLSTALHFEDINNIVFVSSWGPGDCITILSLGLWQQHSEIIRINAPVFLF